MRMHRRRLREEQGGFAAAANLKVNYCTMLSNMLK
jgi:hypothetical protein